MRTRLLVLTLLALAAGCSERERANPLDPANPQTGGRPQDFNAVAGYSTVTLTWMPQPNLDIDGFLLERLASGDSVYRPLVPLLSRTTGRFVDSGEPNGRTQRYRLRYVSQGAVYGTPAEDEATPGPLRPWVADPGAGALVRLSPDGRDVALRVGNLGGVQSVAVTRTNGGLVWGAARFAGTLTVRDAGGYEFRTQTGLGAPYTLARSPLDESVWLCELDGSVTRFGQDGEFVGPTIGLLDQPTGIAVHRTDGSVWIAERGANRVRHFLANGGPLNSTTIAFPTRVAVDSIGGVAWVTSYEIGRVWRLTSSGARIDSTDAAEGPIGLAIDDARGHAWIADAYGGRVLLLDRATLAVIRTIGPLPDAEDVDVDPATGEAWVVVRARGEIVRLSPTGDVLARVGGFTDPTEVRLDPGQ